MGRRQKRQYTAEFRDEVVKLLVNGEKSVAQVARELAIPKGTLDNWMRKAKEASGELPELVGTSTLSKTEREELLHLRRENERLRQEREILKKAAAFFAKENL
jgi:transposase-like protein